jgi:HlyD family secretion protein
MTATVRFLTGEATNVLTVPNAALRVKPTADMLAKSGLPNTNTSGSTNRPATSGDTARRARRDSTRTGSSSSATLWVVGAKGAVTPVRVRTGLTDGSKTEIQSTTVAEGTQVVIGTEAPGATATPSASPASSPFQTQGAGRRPGGF